LRVVFWRHSRYYFEMSQYFIVSLKHTPKSDKYITVWRPDARGYAWALSWAGRYSNDEVMANLEYFNSGSDSLAVPVEILARIAVDPGTGSIDNDAGPVVLNTAANWKVIVGAPICQPRNTPQPRYQKTRRVSCSDEAAAEAES